MVTGCVVFHFVPASPLLAYNVLGLVDSSSASAASLYKRVLPCTCTNVSIGWLPGSGVAGSK